MAEPEEPKRIPLGPPGSPIPRIWKAEPEDVPTEEEAPKKKKKKSSAEPVSSRPSKRPKKSKSAKAGPDGEKGVLLEDTPALETYEARRLIRVATGVLIVLVVFLVCFGMYKMFGGGGGDSDIAGLPDEAAPTQPPIDTRQVDRESRNMLDRAHELAVKGKADQATAILTRLVESYPESKAAKDATTALERSRKNLPLFADAPGSGKAEQKGSEPGKVATEPSKAATGPRNVAAAPKMAPAPVVPSDAPPEAAIAGAANAAAVGTNPPTAGPIPTGDPPQIALATKGEMPRPKTETPSRPLPPGFRKREGTGIHSSGWPNEIVSDKDPTLMVFVPGGTFTMGRDDGEPGEGPSHKVTMTAYYIDQHEVTVRQFRQFEKESGRRTDRTRALTKLDDHAAQSEDFPVVMVTARDADDYAQWAGKQLPTEAQWEFAARGTDGRIYPWGPDPPQWAKPRKPRQIDPVNSFSIDVSPFGISDMAGNAWEWTRDWYDPKYHQQFRNGPVTNPTGPATRPRSNQLAVRGTAKNWVVTKRDGLKSETRLPYLGFRCVLQVEGHAAGPAAGAAPANPPPAQNAGPVPF